MTFKKTIGKLHLWLGLSSGLIVFIIAITGCIYAFQEEIQNATQPYRFVEKQDQPFLLPSEIQTVADSALPNKHFHAVMHYKNGQSSVAIYYSRDEYYYYVYVNPYSGEVLKVKNMEEGFFHFILDGHFYLWLPEDIGQTVVASATLVFLIMIITGLILWWPKNKNGRKQRFSIKWKNVRWRRKNYDLHNVMGFYVWVVAFIFAFTGLIFGFQWFKQGVFYTLSGGEQFVQYYNPVSDTTSVYGHNLAPIDKVWLMMEQEYPDADWIEVHPPENNIDAIAANANPDASTYWKTDFRYFDQHTLEELPVTHVWSRIDKATFAAKFLRMNYDIHVGAILGLPGKIIAFLFSLVIASLPITGFFIWYGRNKKKTNSNYNV